MKLTRILISCLLAAFILFSWSNQANAAGSPLNENIGAIMQGMKFSDLQTASGAFFKAGAVLIIISMVAGIKNARDTKEVVFAIISPLILAWAMQGCLGGNGSAPTGWCFFASKIGNRMASEINPQCFSGGQFSLTGIYSAGLDSMMDTLTGGMNTTQQLETQDPSGSGTTNPSGGGFWTRFGNLMSTITNPGKALVGVLLGWLYAAVLFIVEAICAVLLYFACIVMDLMTMLQQFLLILSSVFLPLFIAALGVSSLRDTGMKYIMTCVGIACWPMGWAAGHVGTLALITMASNNVNVLMTHPFNISVVLGSFIIILVLPFWIIVVTLCAPYAMAQMLTTGSNFASGMAQTSLQAAASTAGSALKAL